MSPAPNYLADHRVGGRTVFPAAGFVEMALAATRAQWTTGHLELRNLEVARPLVLSDAPNRLQISVTPESDRAADLRIFSRPSAADAEPAWVQHVRCQIERSESPRERIDLARIQASCPREVAPATFYDKRRDAGLDCGPAFRAMRRVWVGEDEALAELAVDDSLAHDVDGYLVHPTLLDAAFHVVSMPALESEGSVYVPTEFSRIRYLAPAGRAAFCHVTIRERSAHQITSDVRLFDREGRALLEIEGFVKTAVAPAAFVSSEARWEKWAWRVEWKEGPRPTAASRSAMAPARWLILADRKVGESLARRLTQAGHTCIVAVMGERFARVAEDRYELDPRRPEDFAALWREVNAGGACASVLHLWALEEMTGGLQGALHLSQGLLGGDATPPALWLVTRGAQAVAHGPVSFGQAPLLGFGRVLSREHPELRCTLLDLDADAQPSELVDSLVTELSASSADEGVPDELAYRAGRRYLPRLARYAPPRQPGPFTLDVASRGDLSSLRFCPNPRRAPAEGEVEVRIHAASLNFRDVLNVLGMYPGTPPLGSDLAGTIVAVGAGVTDFAVGDEVVGRAEGSFRSYVTCPAIHVARKPKSVTFEEASGLPVALLTAYYTIQELARARPGERILIHTASGGTGLAAVQIAQRAGLEVLATAGSEKKKEYLRSLGIQCIANSRSLDFADEVRRATYGEGVDIILNTLSGDYIGRSVSLLRPGGRFIELGRREIWTEQQMAAVRPDVTYYPVDLGDVWKKEPVRLNRAWAYLMEELGAGRLRPIPMTVFGLSEAAEAFTAMRHARHIGKIVFTQDIEVQEPSEKAEKAPRIRPDATYVVTGGLGGLGLLTARWLVERGARALVLAGRRGRTSESEETLAWMETQGARVLVAEADMARAEDVVRMLDEARATLPPIRGVLHCAGVISDRSLELQSWDGFERVLSPKVQGAWNLHTHTHADPLDFFVLFSSNSAIVGMPGQSNYAAANAFLDALAHHRQAAGLPALSINWGAWSQVGMAAQMAGRRASIDPAEGLRALDGLLGAPRAAAQVIVTAATWSSYVSDTAYTPALLSEASSASDRPARAPAAAPQTPQPAPARPAAAAATSDDRRIMVRQHVSRVSGLSLDEIPCDLPLVELGLDSLMMVELRNTLSSALGGRRLPMGLVLRTVDAIAEHVGKA